MFVLGLLIGGWCGFLLFALCVAARDADDRFVPPHVSGGRTESSHEWVIGRDPVATKSVEIR